MRHARVPRWIGPLLCATLLLVPVLYAIFVLDLKIVTWGTADEQPT